MCLLGSGQWNTSTQVEKVSEQTVRGITCDPVPSIECLLGFKLGVCFLHLTRAVCQWWKVRGGNYAERCTSCWTLTSFYRQLVHLFPFLLRFLAEALFKPWYHITYQSYWSVRGLTSRHAQSRYFKRGSYSPILLLIATIHIFASTFQDKGSWYKFIKQVAPVIDAIQPHEDGPRYHPVVATVS